MQELLVISKSDLIFIKKKNRSTWEYKSCYKTKPRILRSAKSKI